jgi:hypothetical protein
MPTGCKSVYLSDHQSIMFLCRVCLHLLPAGNLERGPENLGSYEFSHV